MSADIEHHAERLAAGRSDPMTKPIIRKQAAARSSCGPAAPSEDSGVALAQRRPRPLSDPGGGELMWWMTVLGLGFITAAWWMTVRAVMLSPTRQRTRRSQVQPWPDARPRRVVAMDALGRWAVSKAKGWAPELDKIEPMSKRLPERVLLSDGRRVHAVTACRHGEHDWTRIRISSMGGDVAKACTRCSKFVDLSETGIDDLDIEMEWIGRPPKSERRRARWVGERGAEPVIYPVPDLERRNLDIRGDID